MLPDGCEAAWALFQRLQSPSVREFGLQEFALQCEGTITVTQTEGKILLDEMDSIFEGQSEAAKVIAERKAKERGK